MGDIFSGYQEPPNITVRFRYLMLLSLMITVFSLRLMYLCPQTFKMRLPQKATLLKTPVISSFRQSLPHLPSPGAPFQ